MPRLLLAALGAAALLCGGCGTDPATTVAVQGGPSFAVQIADDAAEREQGLSGRQRLEPGTGMLFVYSEAAPRAYWMRGMRIPIDLAWIRDGTIIGTLTLQPCPATGACEQHASPGPVDLVLEVSAGALDGIAEGTAVIVE